MPADGAMRNNDLLMGGGAAALMVLAVAALWSPGGWGPGWASAGLDLVAAAYLLALTGLAVRARFDFVRGRGDGHHATVLGSVLIGVVFALILTALAAGGLYAVAAKHGVYQPFFDAPSRLQTLAFFLNEALKGALFDALDVFGADLPGAPAYDPRARWGFALAVVAFRFTAAFAVWSLIFAYVAKRARRA